MSGLAIRAPWQDLDTAATAALPAATGVFEIERDGSVIRVGYAGARSLFGLRGVLTDLAAHEPGAHFRAEVTTAYLSRWRELLGAHLAEHGALPPGNAAEQPARLRPIGPRGATSR
jgi:hypothetical protein